MADIILHGAIEGSQSLILGEASVYLVLMGVKQKEGEVVIQERTRYEERIYQED